MITVEIVLLLKLKCGSSSKSILDEKIRISFFLFYN